MKCLCLRVGVSLLLIAGMALAGCEARRKGSQTGPLGAAKVDPEKALAELKDRVFSKGPNGEPTGTRRWFFYSPAHYPSAKTGIRQRRRQVMLVTTAKESRLIERFSLRSATSLLRLEAEELAS